MQPPPRYVPELQALAAREVARHVRSLSRENRYHYLRSIPESIRELIQAFPTDFVVWMGDECLLGYENSLGALHFYLENLHQRHHVTEGFREDCELGITRRQVMRRKCGNLYCDEQVDQKIIATPDDVYWNVCQRCKNARGHHCIWRRLMYQIETRLP